MDTPEIIEMSLLTWENFLQTGRGYPWSGKEDSFGFSGVDSISCFNGKGAFDQTERPFWTNMSQIFFHIFTEFSSKKWNAEYNAVLLGLRKISNQIEAIQDNTKVLYIETYRNLLYLTYFYLHKVFHKKRKLDYDKGSQLVFVFEFDNTTKRMRLNIETTNREMPDLNPNEETKSNFLSRKKDSNGNFIHSKPQNALAVLNGYQETNPQEFWPPLLFKSQQCKLQTYVYFENDIIWVRKLPDRLLYIAEDFVSNILNDIFSSRFILKRDVINSESLFNIENVNENNLVYYPQHYMAKRSLKGYFYIDNGAYQIKRSFFASFSIREKTITYNWRERSCHLNDLPSYFQHMIDENQAISESIEIAIEEKLKELNPFKIKNNLMSLDAINISNELKELEASKLISDSRVKVLQRSKERYSDFDFSKDQRAIEKTKSRREQPKDDQRKTEFKEPEASYGKNHHIPNLSIPPDKDNNLDYEIKIEEANLLYKLDLMLNDERTWLFNEIRGIVPRLPQAADQLQNIDDVNDILPNQFANYFWDRIFNIRDYVSGVRDFARESIAENISLESTSKAVMYIGGSATVAYINAKLGTEMKELSLDALKNETEKSLNQTISSSSTFSVNELKDTKLPEEVLNKTIEIYKNVSSYSEMLTHQVPVIFETDITFSSFGSQWNLKKMKSTHLFSVFIYEAEKIGNSSITDSLETESCYKRIQADIDFSNPFRIKDSTLTFPSILNYLESEEKETASLKYQQLSSKKKERRDDFIVFVKNPNGLTSNLIPGNPNLRILMKARISSNVLPFIKFDDAFGQRFINYFKIYFEGKVI